MDVKKILEIADYYYPNDIDFVYDYEEYVKTSEYKKLSKILIKKNKENAIYDSIKKMDIVIHQEDNRSMKDLFYFPIYNEFRCLIGGYSMEIEESLYRIEVYLSHILPYYSIIWFKNYIIIDKNKLPKECVNLEIKINEKIKKEFDFEEFDFNYTYVPLPRKSFSQIPLDYFCFWNILFDNKFII
jgi:hypothetical protein